MDEQNNIQVNQPGMYRGDGVGMPYRYPRDDFYSISCNMNNDNNENNENKNNENENENLIGIIH